MMTHYKLLSSDALVYQVRDKLIFEIMTTSSPTWKTPPTSTRMRAVSGCRFSLDDFGVGRLNPIPPKALTRRLHQNRRHSFVRDITRLCGFRARALDQWAII
jgi:hypothetical protein